MKDSTSEFNIIRLNKADESIGRNVFIITMKTIAVIDKIIF